MTKTDVVLDVRGANYTFTTRGGQVHAVREVDLTMTRGEVLAIVGPSGSGKTTLLQLLAGLKLPTQGSVDLGGRSYGAMKEGERARARRDHLGFVYQSPELVSLLTVAENVGVPGQLARRPHRQVRDEAAEALARFGLAGYEDRWPETLSGGQQQRVSIARATASSRMLVLADEPTASLDSDNAHQVFQALNDAAKHGAAVVIVTHDQRVESHVQDVREMRDGRLEARG